MMRIRVDINGRDIGCIGVHNKQEYDNSGRVKYGVYNLRPDGHKDFGEDITDWPRLGTVWHDREEGAASLTSKVMEEIEEENMGGLGK